MKKEKVKPLRKRGFGILKGIMRLFIKRSTFEYLGEEIKPGSIILSNHEGTSAPLAWELYNKTPFGFWGAYEMNSGLVKLYKYQTKVYYHEKKHWNIHAARAFCLLASPLTNMFYKGLNLISTYPDYRFRHTLKESLETLQNNQSVIIFPEDSTKGYLSELEGFHKGFTMLAKLCLKKGLDVPLYVSYYKKKERKYIVDKPVMLSKLFKEGFDAKEVCQQLCDRCNQLGRGEY